MALSVIHVYHHLHVDGFWLKKKKQSKKKVSIYYSHVPSIYVNKFQISNHQQRTIKQIFTAELMG